jgi:D-amino peptidase
MKVLISVDLEGIAGVSGRDEVAKDGRDYGRFRRLMTEEANQAVMGAEEAGADQIVVNDSHNGMRNLLYEELHPAASLISGFNKTLCMVEGIEGADAAVFIGYHSRAGTAAAAMDHTISGAQVHNWWLNGTLVGESQINAALAAHFGVPVVLVSGDDKLARDIEASLPGTRAVIVKESLGQFTVHSKPRDMVHRLIREGVRDAIRERHRVSLPRVEGPAVFRMEFTRSAYAEVAALWPEVQRIDARTVEVGGTDVLDAWRRAFAAMRLGGTGIA